MAGPHRRPDRAGHHRVLAEPPLDTIKAPVLPIHGSNNTVVPPSQSRDFSQHQKQRGKAHELIELPGRALS
jgi:hypothetical protein